MENFEGPSFEVKTILCTVLLIMILFLLPSIFLSRINFAGKRVVVASFCNLYPVVPMEHESRRSPSASMVYIIPSGRKKLDKLLEDLRKGIRVKK